jgi:hypothetical protein
MGQTISNLPFRRIVANRWRNDHIGLMISSSELAQLIKEPVLSKMPKCAAEGCWYGIIDNDDLTVGVCSECLGAGVAHF